MQSDSSVGVKNKKSWWGKVAKLAGAGALAVLIFLLGIGVGNGQISFSNNLLQNSLPQDLNYSSVEKLYDALRGNYDGQLDEQKLLDGLKAGLAQATGDPYTVYLTADEAKEFAEQLNGTFSGIGAEIGLDEEGNLIVVSPIDGFPAAKAGLRPGDRVISIDGEVTTGMRVDQAVSKIRGPKDSEVTLRILRDGEGKDFKIIRADIKIPSVKWSVLDGIGYLQVLQFGEDTYGLAEQAAKEFKQQNVKGIVLDLRGNPGGLLNASVDVASLWLPRGELILQQKRGNEVVSEEFANGNDLLRGLPTAVLINEGSASASEIVAGALKDYAAATLFGAKTFGKGSVQELVRLNGGGELKVTITHWYTPHGRNIDQEGISPDTEVKMLEEDYNLGRDPQKDAAIQFLKR